MRGMRWKREMQIHRKEWLNSGFWWCSNLQVCVFTVGSYTGIILLISFMQCIWSVFTKGIIYAWKMGQVFMLVVCLSPLSHTVTHNKQNAHRFILNNQEQHRATLGHIYISIHRGLTAFNSTSLRQSFTGCAIHDRHCTEYELWIMQNIHKHQGYSWVNSD